MGSLELLEDIEYLDTLDSVELLENLEGNNDQANVAMFYHFEEGFKKII